MKPKEIIPLEEDDQKSLADCLDSLGLLWYHVPNEIHCKPQYLAKRKRLGVKSGVPDNFIMDAPPKCPMRKGAVIELKRKKGGIVSEDQRRWLDDLRNRGWSVAICCGIDEALATLRGWGYLKD